MAGASTRRSRPPTTFMPFRALLASGSNAQGQLASGGTDDAHAFVECKFLGRPHAGQPNQVPNIIQVACGANHTIILVDPTAGPYASTTRELWGCGDGRKGQLGRLAESATGLSSFTRLDLELLHSPDLHDFRVEAVAASWETSYVALSYPGRSDVLLSLGADDYGDLGIGGKSKSPDTVHVVDLATAAGATEECKLSIRSLSSGPHHILVHLTISEIDGSTRECTLGWGTSRHGQLGAHRDPASGKPLPFLSSPVRLVLPDEEQGVIASALGTHHSILLHPSGRLTALGSDRKGQLDGADALEGVSAVGCTWNGTYAVQHDGPTWSVVSIGNHNKGQLGRPIHVKHGGPHGHPMAVHFPFSHDTHSLVKMACGSEHILCLFTRTDGNEEDASQAEVWAWGWNEHGNLGLRHTQDQDVPVKIWPPSQGDSRQAVDVWAGYGTSWILVEGP